MEYIGLILSVLLGLMVLVAPFFGIYYIFKHIIQYQYWKHFRPISPEKKAILHTYFTYYQVLSPRMQKKFERRVALFIQSKKFIGKNGLTVTTEMQVLVAATAVQITFGFPYFQLPRFTTILIYPDVYLNKLTKQYHKGDVNPGFRTISLSWNNFLQGFHTPDDGINLGFHEMAHALSLENTYTGNYAHHFINKRQYKRWEQLAQQEMQKIQTTGDSLFRKYASVNIHEFWAVCLEVFFEQPNEFAAYHPELFMQTCRVLNQYPQKKAE